MPYRESDLRNRVRRVLRTTGIAPTRIGRDVMNDPGFISRLLAGAAIRPNTRARLEAWLDRHDQPDARGAPGQPNPGATAADPRDGEQTRPAGPLRSGPLTSPAEGA